MEHPKIDDSEINVEIKLLEALQTIPVNFIFSRPGLPVGAEFQAGTKFKQLRQAEKPAPAVPSDIAAGLSPTAT
jgi:hypothetical protein